MKTPILALLILAAQPAHGSPPLYPVSISSTSVIQVAYTTSATVLFEEALVARKEDMRLCDKPVDMRVPSSKLMRVHAKSIIKACWYFWGDDPSAWYMMGYLLMSEGGGNMDHTAPRGEKTYGPYCNTVEEVRTTVAEYKWIGCPKSKYDIIDKLENDPAWAALITAGTIFRAVRRSCGDRMCGILRYKMGDGRFAEVTKKKAPEETEVWKATSKEQTRLLCIRDRILSGGIIYPCQCKSQ